MNEDTLTQPSIQQFSPDELAALEQQQAVAAEQARAELRVKRAEAGRAGGRPRKYPFSDLRPDTYFDIVGGVKPGLLLSDNAGVRALATWYRRNRNKRVNHWPVKYIAVGDTLRFYVAPDASMYIYPDQHHR